MDIMKQFAAAVATALKGVHSRVDAAERGAADAAEALRHELGDLRQEFDALKSNFESTASELTSLKSELGKGVDIIKSAAPDGSAPSAPDASEDTPPPAPPAVPAAPETPAAQDAAAPAEAAPVVSADSTVVKVPANGTTVTLDHATGEVTAVHDASQTPVEADPAAVQAARDAATAAGVVIGS